MQEEDNSLTQQDQEKKNRFEQLYQQQEKERQAQKELKKQLEEQNNDPRERMQTIMEEFKRQHDALSGKISSFKKQNLVLQDLFNDLNTLKNYFLNCNHCLNTFDKQNYKEQLEKLEKNMFILRDMVEPRKKFKFTKRVKQQQPKAAEKQEEEQVQISKQVQLNIPGLENLKSQTITPTEFTESYKLYNLEDCTVYLNASFDNLYIKNLKNCNIFVGPVKTSVFVEQVNGGELNLMCHQLRIHNTENCHFKIYSSSKSIIEYCTKLKFSPYNYKYDNISEHIKSSGFENRENLWRDVQDFNWLKQEKSPNFEIVE